MLRDEAVRERAEPRPVAPLDALALRGERDRAIHRAGVDEHERQRVGQAARDGALAGARGAVDRDDGTFSRHAVDLSRTAREVS